MKKNRLLICLSTLLLLSSCDFSGIHIGGNSKPNSSTSSEVENVSSSEEKETSSSKSEFVKLTGVGIDKESISIKEGETHQLNSVFYPKNASDKSGSWSTDNQKIATVNNGLVTALKAGVTTIYFNSGEFEASCVVNVKKDEVVIPVTGISISNTTISIRKGEKATLTATLSPSNTTEKGIVWSSSNENIATVASNGVVQAINEGTCDIIAKASTYEARCTVTVTYDEYYKKGYTLSWHDEFNGTSLNNEYWDYDIGGDGWGNSELQYYTRNNVKVENGECKIIAKREKLGNNQFTSSRIVTRGKKHFKYGYFESRMKLPSFRGAWPAFWMLGKNIYTGQPWPYCGEIDIMEAANDSQTIWGTLHWNANGKNPSSGYAHQYEGKTTNIVNKTDYHTYACEWSQYSMTIYVDGVAFFTKDITGSALDCFHDEFYILFNFAVGGQFVGVYDNIGITTQAEMCIDYVRVYTKN